MTTIVIPFEPSNTVRCVYWPSQRFPCHVGHMELEISEKLLALFYGGRDVSNYFPLVIHRSLSGRGLPCIIFQITVTPAEFEALKKEAQNIRGITCSRGVAIALAKYAEYKIPQPISLSPLLTAIYLTSAKILGSKRVCCIEPCGRNNEPHNIVRSMTGVVIEGLTIYSILFLITVASMKFYLLVITPFTSMQKENM